MKYRLHDLIDIEHFQDLQDRLNKIYSFPSSIIDNDGKILTATGWQDVCVNFHRKNKEAELICIKSDQYILSHLHEANPAVSYLCPHGLVDIALPIIIDGLHYGNFFTGQFFLEEPVLDFFKAQARKYGFDEQAYIQAIKKVPIWTQEQVDNYLFYIEGLISVISESGLQRVKEIENRKQLQKSEKKYRSILKAALDGYWLTDTSGRLLEVNEAYCRMSGYTEKELLIMNISDLEVMETPEIIAEHMKKVLLKGSDRFESVHRRKDGTIFDVEVSVHIHREEDERCVCFVQDITERKESERVQQKLKNRHEALWTISRMVDSDMKTIGDQVLVEAQNMTESKYAFYGYINERDIELSLHAWSRETMAQCQTSCDRHFPLDKAGIWAQAIREKRILTINNYQIDIPGKKGLPEGHVHMNRLLAVPVLDNDRVVALAAVANKEYDYTIEDGEQLQAFLKNAQILIDRKKAEQDKLKLFKQLQESEQRYREYFEEIPSGAFISAPDGQLLECNQEYLTMFGFRSKLEALATSVISLYERPERRQEFLKAVTEQKEVKRFESHMHKIDGTSLHLLENAVGFFDEEGVLTTIRGYLLDVTEQRNLEVQLLHAQKLEAVGRLAGGVAHDFNNMLSVIQGNAELAMTELGSDQLINENLDEIHKAAQRSSNVVRQLLAFARRQTVAPEVLDLNETVEEMLKMLRRLIGEDIELSWQPGPKLWPVKIDPAQIDQILANLTVNARDAIAGTGKVTIETDNAVFDQAYCENHYGFVPGDFVLLAVSDNGCGMDKDTQKILFEPFFSTKEMNKGTGLGLATVYGIVKQNDGMINVYSEPGEGTTLTIYLPRHVGSDKQTPETDHTEQLSQGSETILLVEDESSILKTTKRMLEVQGYQVVPARSPGEAIRLAKDHAGKMDLLITDVIMPEMNGVDLATNILSAYPNIKRLFMSGYTADVIAHHGVLDQGVNFIQKPFSREQLSLKVREALDNSS